MLNERGEFAPAPAFENNIIPKKQTIMHAFIISVFNKIRALVKNNQFYDLSESRDIEAVMKVL